MNLLECVKQLPPELKEKINYELVKAKVNDRNKMGWGKVHKELVEKIDQLGKTPHNMASLRDFVSLLRMMLTLIEATNLLYSQVRPQSERGASASQVRPQSERGAAAKFRKNKNKQKKKK